MWSPYWNDHFVRIICLFQQSHFKITFSQFLNSAYFFLVLLETNYMVKIRHVDLFLLFFGIKTVHYEGTLADTGEVFDTTREDNAIFSFEIGTGSVIKAWDVALRTMKVDMLFKLRWLYVEFMLVLNFLLFDLPGWWSSCDYLQARICLWKCWIPARYPPWVS